MLVSGPIATSKSSLQGRGIRCGGRDGLGCNMLCVSWGQRWPGLQHALCQLGWLQPAAQQARHTLYMSCMQNAFVKTDLASSSSDQMQHMLACAGVVSRQPKVPCQQLIRPYAQPRPEVWVGQLNRTLPAAQQQPVDACKVMLAAGGPASGWSPRPSSP